jgi:hypothetical protein
MDHHAARASSYGSFPAKSATDTQHSTSSGAMMRGTGVAEPLLFSDPSPSSPSHLPPPKPRATIAVARSDLLAALARRSERARRCRSVPLSLAVYAAFIASLLLHAPVGPAYDFETALVGDVVDASGFRDTAFTPTLWFAWLTDSLLPTLLLPGPGSEDPPPAAVAGRVANYGLVLGGVRLAQRRASVRACEDAALSKVYGSTCYDQGRPSEAGFGNTSVADAYGVASAFSPSATPGDPLGPAFQLYINALSDLETGQNLVDGLQEAGWLDEASESAAVQVVLLNGQTNHFGVVLLEARFTPGGRVATRARVGSFTAGPYVNAGFVYVLDAVVFLHTLYLLRGLIIKLGRLLCEGGRGGRGKGEGGEGARPPGASSNGGFNVWLALDLGALASLVASQATWFVFVKKVDDVRAAIAGDADASPEGYAGGEHASTAADVDVAYELHQEWKVAAVCALIFLSLRIFKYFQFQPRLAVMTDSLIMAFSDAVHFALLFAVLLCCYGTWGHFLFGTQAPDWADSNISINSVFRYMMYDYDLYTMQQTFPNMANLFNASFMLVVTNMTLWMVRREGEGVGGGGGGLFQPRFRVSRTPSLPRAHQAH